MKCAICKRKIDEKYVGAIYRIHGKIICQECARAIYNISENKSVEVKSSEKEEQHLKDNVVADKSAESTDKRKLKKDEDIM